MDKLLIKNARAVLTDGITEPTDILVENGKISAIGEINAECDNIINADGNYVFPGFIDIHVHGGGGADFMDATPEAFETAVSAHLKRGTTLMLPTALTATRDELIAFINAYKDFKKSSKYADLVFGLHLEGPYFSNANNQSKGAQSGNLIRDIDFTEVDEILNLANGSIVRWDASPEIDNADKFARLMAENGIICAVAHSDATAEQTINGFKNGFSHITHFYNAVSSHRKREQTVYAGIVEATYLNDDITVELIGDGCHIPKEDFQLAMKIKGAKKVSVITDAMRIAGTDMKRGKLGSLKSGTDVIVDENVAKLVDLTSFAGSICTMDRCLRVLCSDYGISLCDAAVMMSLSPARLLGISDKKGSIEINKDADFVFVDNDFCIQKVILRGVAKYVKN